MEEPSHWVVAWTPIISSWVTAALTVVIAIAAAVQAVASHRVAKLTMHLTKLTQGQALVGLFQWLGPHLQGLQATAERLRSEGRMEEAAKLERFVASCFRGAFGPLFKEGGRSSSDVKKVFEEARALGLEQFLEDSANGTEANGSSLPNVGGDGPNVGGDGMGGKVRPTTGR